MCMGSSRRWCSPLLHQAARHHAEQEGGLRVAGKVPHEEGGFGEVLRTEVGHTGLCSISWCVWFCSSLLSMCSSIWRRAAGALGGCKEAAHGYFLLKKKKKKYDEML